MLSGIRISLANKCQILFGAAVILILVAALAVVWMRMQNLVEQAPLSHAKVIAQAWQAGYIKTGNIPSLTHKNENLSVKIISRSQFSKQDKDNPFFSLALAHLQKQKNAGENDGYWFSKTMNHAGNTIYLYAKAIGKPDLSQSSNSNKPAKTPINKILLIRLHDPQALSAAMVNRIYIVAAGLSAGLLAIGVFWFITTRIILSPVRLLRDYAQRVSEGNTNIRSDINTGDEFQQLSDMFNAMLENLKENEDQLRSTNKSLDLKLGKLEQSNTALYQANKIKGEFLANVSHELRTPLNSIVGFAEVLEEALDDQLKETQKTSLGDSSQLAATGLDKRRRYANNILISSKRLLDLITELLDLAKIEAGKMDLNINSFSPSDTTEGLVNLMKPQADKKDIELGVKISPKLPMVQSDPGKVQQILFNFISNAIKFTPAKGTVTLSVALLNKSPQEMPAQIRFAVSDTGPGIDPEDQQQIFNKFTQLQNSETREQEGTGLGLTICRELATMLGGTIEIDSDAGHGATFSLAIPVIYKPPSAALMPEENQYQANL